MKMLLGRRSCGGDHGSPRRSSGRPGRTGIIVAVDFESFGGVVLSMMRIVALMAAAAGAVVVGQRWQARLAENALWAEITDPAPRERNREGDLVGVS